MLFENGHIEEAIAPYRKAVELRPDAPLLRVGLAQALIESGAPQRQCRRRSRISRKPWRASRPTRAPGVCSASPRAADGLEGVSNLSLAEYALLIGKQDDARLYARRAEAKMDPSNPAWLRLQDVLRVIDES